MTIAVFVLWLRTNWQGLAAGLVLGLAFMGLRGRGEPVPMATATAGASQSLSGTAQAHSGASILAGGRPAMPCPENKICPEVQPVKIVYDCGASVAGGASAAVSASAQVNPGSKGIPLGIAFGGGYRSDSSWDGQLGFKAGNISLDASSNTLLAYRIGLSWTYWFP